MAAHPGENFDKAEFRLWLPNEPGALRGFSWLFTGSTDDSPWVKQSSWREYTERRNVNVCASH